MSSSYNQWVRAYLSGLTTGNHLYLNTSNLVTPPPTPQKPCPPPAATPAKPIGTTGMEGYSERGAPEDWDMAAGEVRGYRWWNLTVPPWVVGVGTEEEHEAKLRYFGNQGTHLGVLTGANSQRWRPGRNEAVCTGMRYDPDRPLVHQPPEIREDCGCGFWAYFSPGLRVTDVLGTSPVNQVPVSHNGSSYNIPVFGVIRGTGRVIIGEKGFRSQYAEITGLCVPDEARVYMLRWYALNSGYYGEDGFGYGNTYFRGDKYGSPGYHALGPASPGEELRRAAYAEALLSLNFPGVKVMSDRKLLTKYFPPDPNYYSG